MTSLIGDATTWALICGNIANIYCCGAQRGSALFLAIWFSFASNLFYRPMFDRSVGPDLWRKWRQFKLFLMWNPIQKRMTDVFIFSKYNGILQNNWTNEQANSTYVKIHNWIIGSAIDGHGHVRHMYQMLISMAWSMDLGYLPRKRWLDLERAIIICHAGKKQNLTKADDCILSTQYCSLVSTRRTIH